MTTPGYTVQPLCSVRFRAAMFDTYDQPAALDIAGSLPQLAEGWTRTASPTPNSAFYETNSAWLHIIVENVNDGYLWSVRAQLYYNNPGVSMNHEIRDVHTPQRRTEAIEEATTRLTVWLAEQLPAFAGGK